jgi:hypothetical protein
MSEHRLWQWLRDRLPVGHSTRIESEAEPGFPDVHFTLQHGKVKGLSVTLELKYADGPKKTPLKGKLRTAQAIWWRREIEVGGIGWVVVELPGKQVFFIPGEYYDRLDTVHPIMFEHWSDLTLPRQRSSADAVKNSIRELIIRSRI